MKQQTNFWRQQASLILSILLFALFIIIVGLQAPTAEIQPYDLDSPDGSGLLALRLWLEEMDYDVQRTGQQQFELGAEHDLLFIYPNQALFTEEEAAYLHEWVQAGSTAVIVGPSSFDSALLKQFEVYDSRVDGLGLEVAQAQPLLPDDEVQGYQIGPMSTVNLEDNDRAVAILQADKDQATAAAQVVGQGLVWHLSYEHDLTNGQLRDEELTNLVLPLLRDVPASGTVLFDTYHLLGPIASADPAINSLREWLYGTPFGWATLFGILTYLGYLVLQGRRLGPPLPEVSAERKREAAEYVEAMAQLHQRTGQRTSIADYQKQRLKIGIGRALHVRPDLEDTIFVETLQTLQPPLDKEIQQSVVKVLNSLRGQPDEAKLVWAAAEVDRLLKMI